MMRALIVLMLAVLAPAFAADAPAPNDRSGPSEPSKGYALISMQDVIKLTELIGTMTETIQAQDGEIRRLQRLAEKGGCV